MITVRSRAVIAAATLTVLGAATVGAWAQDSTTVSVTTAVINGTRTLHVTSPTGADLANQGLALGHGQAGAFLVNVTDADYKHAGYQVSATMSNLYPYTTSYDFTGKPIPSSDVSVGYPANLSALLDVKSLVTPVFTLAGSVGLLSLPASTVVDAVPTDVATLTSDVTQSTLGDVLDELPVKLLAGESGTFDMPAQITGGPTVSGTPTQKILMSGTAQSPAALVTALGSALSTEWAGKTVNDLIGAGLVDQDSVVSAVAGALGLSPLLLSSGQLSDILDLAVSGASILPADGILGQSGTYNSVPALSVNVPTDTAAGIYRGEMVVTLMDN